MWLNLTLAFTHQQLHSFQKLRCYRSALHHLVDARVRLASMKGGRDAAPAQ